MFGIVSHVFDCWCLLALVFLFLDACFVLVGKVIADMEPFAQNKDGSRGEKLPEVASGDNVDIILEPGRYHIQELNGNKTRVRREW